MARLLECYSTYKVRIISPNTLASVLLLSLPRLSDVLPTLELSSCMFTHANAS